MTDAEYRITTEDSPERADVEVLGEALVEFNRTVAGDDGFRPLAFFLRDPEGAVVGGVYGATYWGWFYVDLLWVRDDLRGQGYGHRLLAMAEAEAVARGCGRAFLDTFGFQAPAFYRKRGYEIFGELPDFPPDQSRYYMVKRLDGTADPS